jgi:hypothetical protein
MGRTIVRILEKNVKKYLKVNKKSQRRICQKLKKYVSK